MHFCLLIGYGAGAVNPYLAFATLAGMIRRRAAQGRRRGRRGRALHQGGRQEPDQGRVQDGHLDRCRAIAARRSSRRSGSTSEVIDQYFTWTASRIGGVGLDAIARETARAPSPRLRGRRPNLDGDLDVGGQYQWRRRGEYHMYNPNTIAKLQHAVRSGNYRLFKEYTRLVDDHSRSLATLRGLLKFKPTGRRSRSRRSSRRARSSSASRPARCRSARSARRRTRTSRSR